MEKLDGVDIEISNLEYYIEKSIELSQNIHKYWQLGSLDIKKKNSSSKMMRMVVLKKVRITARSARCDPLWGG